MMLSPLARSLDGSEFSTPASYDRGKLTQRLPPVRFDGCRKTEEEQFLALSKDELLHRVVALQNQLIHKDALIHDLNTAVNTAQLDDQRKHELKRGFSVIERRHVDTSTTQTVLEDAFHHLLVTVTGSFGGVAGILLLDVPYNSLLGATNSDLRKFILLSSYWSTERADPLELALEDLHLYRDFISQKRPKTLVDDQLLAVQKHLSEFGATPVGSCMVVPIVLENTTVALLVQVDGTFNSVDAKLLYEMLPEIWTSNVQSLINIALDTLRKEKMEETLVQESMLRDDLILALERVVDAVMQQLAGPKQKTTSEIWTEILTKVANFFEAYFKTECLIAVTNAEANLRIKDVKASSRPSSAGTRKGSASVGGLRFMHYIFSDSTRVVRLTRMKHLATPSKPRAGGVWHQVLASGVPFFTNDVSSLILPEGHMKMSAVLMVPIIFLGEPVGLVGLANGEFSLSTGRILQSVFTTFWSMIVKSTVLSESQRVLNAALPPAVSNRVKRGEVIADSYDFTTVLFADMVSFSDFTKDLSSEAVVAFSNLIFNRLDQLVKEYGLEKIKVIGDCYMVVGGVQDKSGTKQPAAQNPCERAQMKQMAEFATRIIVEGQLINARADSIGSVALRENLKKQPLAFRVGIAAGALTAGVFGTEKVQYDVLGATVNMASRLQSNGKAGEIHVSAEFREPLYEEGYVFETRDPVTLKGFGECQTYFLKGKAGEGLL
ncbi:Adenylate cyclase [Diplonema papillatum]|nr:Adenylate cyclase [Diplonema papillatum]